MCSPILVWLLLQQQFRAALLVVLLGGVTDWLDGYAARRLGVMGTVGVVLDPLADKVMLVTLFVLLSVLSLIPAWMLALMIVRDLVIVTGALLLRIYRNIRKFRPALSGKVSTFFQIMLVLLALIYAAYPFKLFDVLAKIALVLCAFFTVLSGVEYVRKGILMTRRRWQGD